MAYLQRIEPQEARADRLDRDPGPRPGTKAEFTPLEWSVIRLARVDSLSTLRLPGRFRRFFSWLMGRQGSPELANERLEALRRMAVLSWHFGFTVPGDDVADFLSAGFSPDQYELMVHSIRAAISALAKDPLMNMLTPLSRVDGEAVTLRAQFNQRPLWQRAAIVGAPLALLAAAVTFWNSDPSPAAAPPMPMVTVAAPLERDINQWDDYVGRFEASRSVEVRPRVSGADRRRPLHRRRRSSARASCSSPSTRARSPRRWPKLAPASPPPRASWRWPKPTLAAPGGCSTKKRFRRAMSTG